MDLKGLSISDPQGDDDGEWPRKTGKGTAPVEHNFKFTKSDRDKEMAFLLKKFYQGELVLEKSTAVFCRRFSGVGEICL